MVNISLLSPVISCPFLLTVVTVRVIIGVAAAGQDTFFTLHVSYNGQKNRSSYKSNKE